MGNWEKTTVIRIRNVEEAKVVGGCSSSAGWSRRPEDAGGLLPQLLLLLNILRASPSHSDRPISILRCLHPLAAQYLMKQQEMEGTGSGLPAQPPAWTGFLLCTTEQWA